MYAVIQTGGKQVRVEQGDVVEVEKLAQEAGQEVIFDRVLMVGEGESSRVGSPTVEGARVRGTVIGQDRHRKILVYVFKRRKNSDRRRQGHRQSFTAVRIEAIEA